MAATRRWLSGTLLVVGGTIVLAYQVLFVLNVYVSSRVEVDNCLGIYTGRDVELVKNKMVRNETVEQRIHRLFVSETWRGRHFDALSQTFVTCSAVDTHGRAFVFHWEVDHDFQPLGDTSWKGIQIFALTKATGRLTPELVMRGLKFRDLPTSPSMEDSALYGLRSP